MKSKREMDSKAGTSKNENSIVMLKNMISKSASSLLIAMAGFGLMSFSQDDTAISNADTNLNANTEVVALVNNDNCCATELVKPADEGKKSVIKFRGTQKSALNADLENFRNFIAEIKENRTWGGSLAKIRASADEEAFYNFRTSMLVPAADIAKAADTRMIAIFEEEILLQSAYSAVMKADAEAFNSFWADNFSITVPRPTIADDAKMFEAFEDSIFPRITLPSAAQIALADTEVVSNLEASLKQDNIAVK
ncbi:MAG: hypothetical protein KIT80_00085 [Chitinophagaceae bacterium]|nr:hypothetical protein [Chitinophagaceae bacterium]MCW5925288.1 hypothetical protein [Chitinophagaceae bacterium]